MDQWYTCSKCNNDILYGVNPCPFCKCSVDWPSQNHVTPPITKESQQISSVNLTDVFVFDVEGCILEELAQCHIGDYVSLWVPKDDLRKVYIFRHGCVGGSGRIGYVPGNASEIIANHLSKGLEYETEILEISINQLKYKVRCRLISEKETAERHVIDAKLATSRLKSEVQRSYTPKEPITIRIDLPKNHNLNEGQELYLETRPLEYYYQNASILQINFVEINGVVVAQKSNEPQLIRNILRAFFNQYAMNFRIISIATPDKYTLNYVDKIEAKAKVTFTKSL